MNLTYLYVYNTKNQDWIPSYGYLLRFIKITFLIFFIPNMFSFLNG